LTGCGQSNESENGKTEKSEVKMDNFQIRSKARRLLSGKWWMLALVWLLYWLLNSVSGVNLIVGGPLTLGVSALFLKINRGQDFQLEEMFSGFNDFGRALTAYLLILIYVLLWSLLLIVPGIIAAISYSRLLNNAHALQLI
jgi:uncharacterized membrane protein